jgi:hypothetical protein
MINRESCCTSNQLVEIDDISGYHHGISDMPYTVVEDSPCILFDSTNSSQVVGYLKYEPREAFQDNEALWSRPMVMSGPHYFSLSSGINDNINTKTLPQGTFHADFIHDSHEGILLIFEFPPTIL